MCHPSYKFEIVLSFVICLFSILISTICTVSRSDNACISYRLLTTSRHELPFPDPAEGLLAKFRPLFNDIDGTDELIFKLFVLYWRLIITEAIYIRFCVNVEQNILYSMGKEGASNLVSLLSKSLEPGVDMHNNDCVICSCVLT